MAFLQPLARSEKLLDVCPAVIFNVSFGSENIFNYSGVIFILYLLRLQAFSLIIL
jgi:hypothetical protein